VIVIGDGLTSNAPFIGMLRENDMNFIIGSKPCDQKAIIELIHNKDAPEEVEKTRNFKSK
jgi:hypothetical protein